MGIVMYPLLRYCHVGNWSLLQPHLGLILFACLGFVFSTLIGINSILESFLCFISEDCKIHRLVQASFYKHIQASFQRAIRLRFKKQLGFVSRKNQAQFQGTIRLRFKEQLGFVLLALVKFRYVGKNIHFERLIL